MEKYPSLTQIIVSISVMIALLLLSAIQAKSEVESYNSVIALKVTELTNEQFDQLSQAFDQKPEAHIDYVCQQSGILVVKLTESNLKDKGDIHTYLKSIFSRAAKIRNIEILHVYTEDSSGGQC
ncbi:MAG: hypothetical protein ACR2MX_12325 [Cyclobacteriaceae bacterium]